MAAFNSVDDLYQSMIDQCSSLQDKNLEMEESILETLFRDRKYDLVLYALEKGFTLTPERIEQIKVSGDLKLYQYLLQHKKLTINVKLMNVAVKSGNLETVKWLRSNKCSWDESTGQTAARYGHLEILKWVRENGCPWDERTCAWAANEGHLEVLKWARENGCPWNALTCAGAGLGGHLKVLKWSRKNGCPWDVYTCGYAAEKGHLEVLKWARENGSPWGPWIYINAAEGGHLEVLKWLRENRCPWEKERCLREAKNHPLIVEWIQTQ